MNTIILPHDEYGRQLYIGRKKPTCADFTPPFDTDPAINKPQGGFWTSTWTGQPNLSPWVRWAAAKGSYTNDEKGWIVNPSKGARLAVIDSREDFEKVLAEYGVGKEGTDPVIDFVGISHEYDGLWATANAVHSLCSTDRQANLSSWDVESTVWFDWQVETVEPVGKISWEDHPQY